MSPWAMECVRGAVLAALAGLLPVCAAEAHCFVGIRFLPATLTIDDPCVADELSLPTVSWSKSGDTPPVTALNIGGDFAKRITENFGITIGDTWTRLTAPGAPRVSGFQNLDTTFQYQLVRDGPAEFAMSGEIGIDWGATGARSLAPNSFSTITASVQFGKGFGNLPDSMGWARPFALTGQVGYSWPASGATNTVDPDTGLALSTPNPQFFTYGATLQYSMPFLRSSVVDLELPTLLNHLIPIVEAQFATPAGNSSGLGLVTTGTVNPGVIWVGTYFQVAVEAIVPINRESGSGVGVIAQLHLYLDDMFPRGIGRPLFGDKTSTPAPLLGY